MSAPLPGIRYSYRQSTAEWVAPGRESLPAVVEASTNWTNENLPWQMYAGESLLDDKPAGAAIVEVGDYTSSTDIYTVLTTVASSVSTGVYLRLAEDTYYINTLQSYSANSYLGYANGNRRILGLVGRGAEKTFIQASPTMISSVPDAMNYVLNATATPAGITGLYFSDLSASAPFFFSGITFRGTLQTPFSVYSSASQSYFRKNHGVASPLAWNGMSLWRAQPGSRFQYCRFQGFGFALNSAPPYECGVVNSNYSNGLVIYRCEIDGRIAPEIDPAQPVSSGGWMWNKELNITMQDCWEHHTRRSGWASNTNTLNTSEVYKGINFKCERIADTNDAWAGDNGFFNGSNVEGIIGTFTYTNCYLNVTSGSHINWAVPYSGANGVYPVPDHPVIKVRGFQTDDTLYGGCLRIGVSKNPNSTGLSPIWNHVNTNGIANSGMFEIQDAEGNPLIGVLASAWTSSMTPDQYYVVKM